MSLQERRETYTGERARKYERTRQGEFWELEQQTMAAIVAELSGSVLDVPVGTGRFLRMYEERGLDVHGVDLSRDMLKEAQRKGTAAKLTPGSIFALPFPDDSFDHTVSVRFFNWLETPEVAGALRELRRVARSTLIVGAGTKNGSVRLKSVQCIHEEPEFLAAIEAAGLSVVDRHLVQHNDRGLFEFWVLS